MSVFPDKGNGGEPIPILGETDTMPSFAGSNWYFYRYLDNKNERHFCEELQQKKWLPVDMYVGGSEHTTGHVLYARFVTKFLYDLGFSVVDEPFAAIRNVGLMMGSDGQKMSKSRGNVVAPDPIIEKYGSDAYRMHICFIGVFEDVKNWKEEGMKGVVRFLRKFEGLFRNLTIDENSKQMELALELRKDVGRDVERFKFNTAVAKFMIFVNEMSRFELISKAAMREALIALEPFAPKICKQLKPLVMPEADLTSP